MKPRSSCESRAMCGGRTDGHDALHHDYSYLIVDATSAVNIIMSRHDWQVAHDTRILAALLGAQFPSATTTAARFVLKISIIPLYTPDEAGGIGAFETPGSASKQPDAVYRIGWKNSGWIRGMTFAEYFGPLPVLVSRFMKQPEFVRPFRGRHPWWRRSPLLFESTARMGWHRWHGGS